MKNKQKTSKKNKVVGWRAVLWECPICMTHNLHPTNTHHFDCICCGITLFAEGPKPEILEEEE